jgi:hypothetical protein
MENFLVWVITPANLVDAYRRFKGTFYPKDGDCTYLLTPWSRVLLEKLTGLQLVKKFPAIY